MAELCDIYDINGNKTGDVFVRGEPLKEEQYQLASNIWIINNDLQILIQKRSELKNISPNIYGGNIILLLFTLNTQLMMI